MFVDSHCHLNYLDDWPLAIEQAFANGVQEILCIGVDQSGIKDVLAIAAKYEHVYATVGEHPGSVSSSVAWMDDHLENDNVVACGEMGLDYFYEKDPKVQSQQRVAFAAQMAKAEALDLPVVIHTRDAKEDTLAILSDFPKTRGVLHCFTEDWDMAQRGIELGYYVSISGIVTFKQAENVREVARRLPKEKLLIETDAPWLAPVPHRGKQNQPLYVCDTAQYLAELRGETLTDLAVQTTRNFHDLFNLTVR
ncbi:MAG: TatD DNase family protein [Limisphaerales bacterium]